MVQINECLADPNNDWEKRVDSLKRLRSLAIAATQNDYDEEFFVALKQITNSFCLQIKDLRSQIVREACISIAFLSTTIGARLEKFCEDAMTHLINLMQNSAKVMALSGVVAIRFIIENTHSTRLVPLLTGGVASRSKEIRRNCLDFIRQFLETWDSHHLDKHVNLITSTIKKGLADADPEARVFSRKAFWAFSSHNSSAADHLLNSLDAKTQKLLQNGSKGAFGSVKSLKDGAGSGHSAYQSANTFNYDFMDSQNSRTKQTPTKSELFHLCQVYCLNQC
jgi:CLIP-associating protein 1/2